MTPTQILHSAMGRPTYQGGARADAPCCVCGKPGALVADTRILKDGFTNWDRLTPPYSTICGACAVCITEPKLRRSSWLANPERIMWLRREDIWGVLFHDAPPLTPPFVMYVTTSWKKHGALKTRVNCDWGSYYVQFEEHGVIVEPGKIGGLAESLETLYSIPRQQEHKKSAMSFFTKEHIKTGCYPPARILNFGLELFDKHETTIRPYRRTPILALLLWALNQKRLGIDAREGT